MVAIGTLVAFVVLALIIVMALTSSSIKIIAPYEQGIYIRLGRYVRTLGQGVNFITPLVSTVVKTDLRTQVLDVPGQHATTKDRLLISIDMIVYAKVIDPRRAYFQVTNFRTATIYLAQTTLRTAIGGMNYDEVLAGRGELAVHLRDILDRATDAWGVMVEKAEIRNVEVLGSVKESMERLASIEELGYSSMPRDSDSAITWRNESAAREGRV